MNKLLMGVIWPKFKSKQQQDGLNSVAKIEYMHRYLTADKAAATHVAEQKNGIIKFEYNVAAHSGSESIIMAQLFDSHHPIMWVPL